MRNSAQDGGSSGIIGGLDTLNEMLPGIPRDSWPSLMRTAGVGRRKIGVEIWLQRAQGSRMSLKMLWNI